MIFDFKGFTVNINSRNLSNAQSLFIKNEVKEKINIDELYFSGNYASVFFKTITNFDNESLIEICKLQKSIWNQRKVPFLYVSTPTELRIYNCFEEPIDPNTNLKAIEKLELLKYSTKNANEHLQNLVSLFSRVSIDSGEFWKDDKITQKFNHQKRVDNVLIKNLKDTKTELVKRKIPAFIIHELLTRSLFILYLEDIGATDAKYYHKIKKDANSYFHILTDIEATYNFYKFLEKKFNGNLFSVSDKEKSIITKTELKLIASCFWGDEVASKQKTIWKKFDFKVIPIELLSQIYEIFLNKTDKEKSKGGEYYTPHSLVDLILNESLPWADENNQKSDLQILDIACGSGIFLVESYRRLVDRWIFSNKKQPEFEELKNILLNSIFGFEINPESIKVASFSLYLALISYLNPKTIWQKKNIKFPNLIYEPNNTDKEKQGKNLFRLSSLSNIIEHQPTFDLILGNPPFKSAKTGSLEPEYADYCKKYGFAQEMVLPFLHRASQLCNDNGNVAIISTSKILFNKSGGYQQFRKFIFNDTYVKTVFNLSSLSQAVKGLGKKLFADAVAPSCVLFYKKNTPEKQNRNITYICPKPTESNQFTDDLVLDTLDFYYLPRKECQKTDTIIWKTAMWGTENDFSFIQKLSSYKSLNKYLTKKNNWYKGGGFKFITPTKDNEYTSNNIKELPILESKFVERYTSKEINTKNINKALTNSNIEFYLKHYNVSNKDKIPPIDLFRHKGQIKTYYKPHVLIKEGQSNRQFSCSYLNFDCSFKHTITGITFEKEGIFNEEFEYRTNILKAITAFLNSKFTSYFLFLTSMSWGIDIGRITANDLFQLPGVPFMFTENELIKITKKIDKIIKLTSDIVNKDKIESIEDEINEIIYKTLNLSDREIFLIEDIINYGIETHHNGKYSPAYKPINKYNDELKSYLEIICEDINEHLQFADTNTTVWASIQETPVKIPMKLVAIHFTNEYKKGYIKTFDNSKAINKLIKKIDNYSYEKHSASVYFRKVIKYYEGDIIYIIKPNQKRFWSRSQAMLDSNSVLLEIANM